jgi:hypothetical protein
MGLRRPGLPFSLHRLIPAFRYSSPLGRQVREEALPSDRLPSLDGERGTPHSAHQMPQRWESRGRSNNLEADGESMSDWLAGVAKEDVDSWWYLCNIIACRMRGRSSRAGGDEGMKSRSA